MSSHVHHRLSPMSCFVALSMVWALSCTSPKSADGSGDKPSNACEEHCICVGLVCSDVDIVDGSYDTCIERCATWSVEEMVCATEWCEPVMWTLPKSFKNHACEHSTMSSGLYVCLGYDHDTSDDGGASDTGESDVQAQDAGFTDVSVDVNDTDGLSLPDGSCTMTDAGPTGDVSVDAASPNSDGAASDASSDDSDVATGVDGLTQDGIISDASAIDAVIQDSVSADGAVADGIASDA
ncbi:MAG: hypothetical protein CMH53_09185, partial [Myxococcales bacterium]|nr:hypothetical protein [Myxococcales bacterium]